MWFLFVLLAPVAPASAMRRLPVSQEASPQSRGLVDFDAIVAEWMHSDISFAEYEAAGQFRTELNKAAAVERVNLRATPGKKPSLTSSQCDPARDSVVRRIPELSSLDEVVELVFRVPDNSVNASMMTELAAGHSECSILQVLNGKVYHQATGAVKRDWSIGRFLDSMYLLDLAAKRGLPDVEMLFCFSDYSNMGLRGQRLFNKVPVFGPFGDLGNDGSVPFPMLARDHHSYYRSGLFLNQFQDYSNDSTRVPWTRKESVAFFRGGIIAQCVDCVPKRPLQQVRSGCIRNRMISGLRDMPGFDIRTSKENFVPAAKWEQKKHLVVIGNAFGWADRTSQNLFKSSSLIYVDQSSFEWYYPLLHHKVHFLRTDPNVESLKSTVEWALDHDRRMQDMIPAMNNFARETLNINNIVNYIERASKKYAAKLNYLPTRRDGFVVFKMGGI